MTAPYTPTRPGVSFNFTSSPPNRTAYTNTGVAYVATVAAQGRSDRAVLCRNMTDVVNYFGARSSASPLYDWADVAFRNGLQALYVGRRVGPAAAKASVTLKDASAVNTLTVGSLGPGPSTFGVAVVAGAISGSVVLQVTDSSNTSVILEQSPPLSSVTDLANWANNKSNYITASAVGSTIPAVVARSALTGGVTDNANVTDATLQADLDRLFPRTLGPGQVVCPGLTTTAAQVAMLNHAQNNNRFAILDGLDSSSDSSEVAMVQAIHASASLQTLAETYGMLWAPWRVVPGVTVNTTRLVQPSATICGLIAASDAAGSFNANSPAAGANGIDSYSLSSSQVEWTETQRANLNINGVNVFKLLEDGTQRAYGWRTLAFVDGSSDASAAWLSAGAARLRMAIASDLGDVAQAFLFQQIDGNGHLIAAFNGAIIGVLNGYWAGRALYGTTSDAAFSVDTGPSVNTPVTLSNNELHAHIGIRISPFAEMVYFDVNKAALTAASV